MDNTEPLVKELISVQPASGEVTWIGLRPAREETVRSVESAEVTIESGFEGDHYTGRAKGDRQVTLIQAEHLEAIASFLGRDSLEPEQVRRNVVVKGVNLYALRNRKIKIGDVELEGTGLCHPCSKMEKILGPGAYNAMRGHGGLTARVITEGTIQVGDKVDALPIEEEVAS